MRVLFASTSGAGHFGPLVPFANVIRRAGHEVLVAAPMSAQARVERAGLPFISFADPLERDLEPLWARIRTASPDEANAIVLGESFGRVRAAAALPGVELAMDAWRPDVVLRDACEFASAVAAALLAGVPQTVVPLFADQHHNARRIADLGAGLAVDAKDPATVRAAVERLLAEPAFRVAAGRVALEAQGVPPRSPRRPRRSRRSQPPARSERPRTTYRVTPSRASSASASVR
jgi:hypothetical protein